MTDERSFPQTGPWAEIDGQAIRANLAWMKQRIDCATPGDCAEHGGCTKQPPAARIWAVVKANAYGHGLLHALAALQEADGLAVIGLDDALRLRTAGWQGPVLLLSSHGLRPAELGDPALGELHLVIDDPSQLALLQQLAPQPTRRPPCATLHAWLRYAGRLGNQGFEHEGYHSAFTRLLGLKQDGIIAQAGHLHHYAAAEEPELLQQERQEFLHTIGSLPGPRSTGNSAALCGDLPEGIHRDGHWLRCGLLLYGASALPGRNGAELGLHPAMHLRARLLSIKRIRAGQAVGYGDSYRAMQDTCIGTVGIGYSHGLPRRYWQGGRVLINRTGRVVPLAGRVAMDGLTIDLGPHATEQAGDVVTLWGTIPGGCYQAVETVAQACDTIAAELLTGLTARVPLVPLAPQTGLQSLEA